jgi:hypothetical protein
LPQGSRLMSRAHSVNHASRLQFDTVFPSILQQCHTTETLVVLPIGVLHRSVDGAASSSN